jgi:RND family efflux transporter MFP subunit
MKSKNYIALILVVSLTAIAAFTYWYMKPRGTATENIAPLLDSSSATQSLITTARPTIRTFTLRVPWVGTVEAQASVELTAPVAGRVEVIEAEDQARLKKGQLVMRLGGQQIEGARAKLTAKIESLGSQVDLARQTVDRLKQGLKAQLATKDQLAAAQDAQVSLESQLHEARLSLKSLEKQVRLSSPMNGIFTNRRVSVGQDVSAGQVVGVILDTSRLRIAASIFPPQHIDLQGKEVTIRISENLALTGTIQRVLPRASSTGAVTVWIEGPQIDAKLHPGQTAGRTMVVKVKPDTLAVPKSAIVYDSQEHPYLFVSKDDSYEPLRIQVGLEQDGWVEVTSGLNRDQLVVIQGTYELFYRQFNGQFKVKN